MELLLPNEKIKKNIAQIAEEIKKEYGEETNNITILNVLQGASWFTTYLTQELDMSHIIVENIIAKSYEKTESTGVVTLSNFPPKKAIDKRHIIIADDIYDTGRTAKEIQKYINKNYSPKSINFVFMLNKNTSQQLSKKKNIAFNIGNKFVVGFGLDYDGHCRSLKDIYLINPSDIDEIENTRSSLAK